MYLKRLIVVLVVIISAAYSTGFLLDASYKRRWEVLWFKKTDEMLKGTSNYDIIFLGNSRVHFGINPYYIDSVTKLNSYNFGNGGADALDMFVTAHGYLQNHKPPHLAVISVDPGTITGNKILKTRYHYLYYINNDTIEKYMNQTGFLTGLIKIAPFTKYCFFDEYNRTSLFVKGKPYPKFDHNIYKGFLNIHQRMGNPLPVAYNSDIDYKVVSDSAIGYLKNTLTMLQQKGSKIVFIWSPLKSTAQHNQTTIATTCDSILTQIAKERNIKIFHFENDTIYRDDYFVDDIHLNEPGSRVFSRKLGDSINSVFKKR